MNYWGTNSPLGGLAFIKSAKSLRASSYDVTGGNKDYWQLPAGETAVIMDVKGCGAIKHIWMTIQHHDEVFLRKLVLEMYWDGEENPSVRVPLGDFFGVGFGHVKHFVSLPLSTVIGTTEHRPADGFSGSMNCYFPMPFGTSAKVQIINESKVQVENLFFMIDYELTDEPIAGDVGRFHAQYRSETPCTKIVHQSDGARPIPGELPGVNTTGDENYVILDAEGQGQYVGCLLNIDNFDATNQMYTWPGEGDDMIFIDGEKWPPSLHGTGTEDYFCNSWGFPSGEYAGPYHGITLGTDSDEYFGKWSVYRFHIEDPVRFTKSVRVTIEHGHANDQGNDYSSVAYWYQLEPHAAQPQLPSVEKRMPRPVTHGLWHRKQP